MKNIDLNPGGIIGAVAGGAIAAIILFGLLEVENPRRGVIKFALLGLVGGAFAGNFVWGLIFKKDEE